jgi:hypothetical protein
MSILLPTIGPEVPVQSPVLPVYPTLETVVLKGAGYGVSGSQTLTTSGSAQLLVDIPVSALGIDLLTSPKALLTFETAQDLSGIMATPVGYAFAIAPDSDLSNATSFTRDYSTALDPGITPLYFPTTSSLVLTRESDYPPGTSNISIYLTAAATPGFNLTTSNVMSYSFSLVSIA